MHHIISDDWSTTILMRELMTMYGAFSKRKPSPLPELEIQYGDFSYWQHQWLQGEVLETQLDYWRQTLAGAPPLLELPIDKPRPATQTYNGATVPFFIPDDVAGSLKTLSLKEKATLFMTMLAAFKTLLGRYTGQQDIVVGVPIANRSRAELEELIGLFVNTLVMRTDISNHPGFRQLLGQVRETAIRAFAHQDLPFERIVETSSRRGIRDTTLCFRSRFNYKIQLLEPKNRLLFH